MYAKVIRAKIDKDGVIRVVVHELPPGDVDVVILPHVSELHQSYKVDVKKLPIGGYKAGWLSPKQLRREAIYEEV